MKRGLALHPGNGSYRSPLLTQWLLGQNLVQRPMLTYAMWRSVPFLIQWCRSSVLQDACPRETPASVQLCFYKIPWQNWASNRGSVILISGVWLSQYSIRIGSRDVPAQHRVLNANVSVKPSLITFWFLTDNLTDSSWGSQSSSNPILGSYHPNYLLRRYSKFCSITSFLCSMPIISSFSDRTSQIVLKNSFSEKIIIPRRSSLKDSWKL